MAAETTESPTARWYLGFDCATKTFAFSLSRVDLAAYRERGPAIAKRARAAREAARRAEALLAEARGLAAAAKPANSQPLDPQRAQAARERASAALAGAGAIAAALAGQAAADDAETAGYVRILDGAVADLAPGRADDDVPTVARIRAVAQYVEARVRPAVRAHVPAGARLKVAVEFQMGPNAPARTVAAALITLFAGDDVFIVGPSLKNKVHADEAGRYGNFVQRYATTYAANKAHARHNFAAFERAFGTGIAPTRPAALRGHIADSFMQVLGHEIHGPGDEKAAEAF